MVDPMVYNKRWLTVPIRTCKDDRPRSMGDPNGSASKGYTKRLVPEEELGMLEPPIEDQGPRFESVPMKKYRMRLVPDEEWPDE